MMGQSFTSSLQPPKKRASVRSSRKMSDASMFRQISRGDKTENDSKEGSIESR